MAILNCDRCGRAAEKPDDVRSYTCGLCVMLGVNRIALAEEARLREYTPEQSKKARKAKKWTQAALAIHLKISAAHITNFERGADLIDPKHAEWLDAQ